MKLTRSIFTILSLALLATACGPTNKQESSANNPNGVGTMQKLGPEFTSAYICPMHCEGSGSDKPGKCLVCDMDYRPNPDYRAPDGTVVDTSQH